MSKRQPAPMPTRKKQPKSRKSSSPAAAKSPRTPKQPRAIEPPPSFQQGLIEMAQGGALSFLWVGVTFVVLIAIAAAAFGLWSLRPLPSYASESVEAGSPFDVTFRIENTSGWFPLAHLRIDCVLTRGGVPEIAPIAASDVRFPSGASSGLAPGESATFKCPFRAHLEKSSHDDLGVALRSEIYFRSEYDLPVIGSYRITDNTGPYVLNTRLLPPRWTGKPND